MALVSGGQGSAEALPRPWKNINVSGWNESNVELAKLQASDMDLHVFRVTAVGEGSSAERAGFMKDDVISAVDDRAAKSISIAQLREILAAKGTKHRFTVDRKTQPVLLPVEIETTPISTIR